MDAVWGDRSWHEAGSWIWRSEGVIGGGEFGVPQCNQWGLDVAEPDTALFPNYFRQTCCHIVAMLLAVAVRRKLRLYMYQMMLLVISINDKNGGKTTQYE